MAWALGEGLATGNDKGLLRPRVLASRAEAAVAVERIVLAGGSFTTVQVGEQNVAFAQQMDMTASMYATGEPGVGAITYTGLTVRIGTVAVDPRVIPLGRLLYVEGYGYAVAADIGSAIKGNRIDLFTHDYNEAAYRFGLQPRRVWLLP
ncbi:MAG TPA: 3D domain-containing protein, partial [Symbiobacteriaceae bacterium]|nr:3D domain-containing protein [Symbiobacteriaceae bacterium]